ncbi:MAG: pilus assembly protein CpaE [Petroclostridium sp.]|jgi:pilus assembly protein CpaE|uniref:response regulator n=1 Tax=Petroclostridium xylanilyticum TaxID=1792311 RepID=UPI000B97E348|nr:response regulator [Petroclostridium xylanilyticum]MBZ4645092.1 response regulator receiver protein [Clostridia bacterium]MDK2811401.1 pilus assembly protein CpaE [Petroclostridium sp.]
MNERIKVIIADDVRETRENIKTLLSFDERIEVVGEAENGEDAVFLVREVRPDIILMDINMPVKDGIKATEEISLEVPETTIVIMSVQIEQEYLRKAMTAGARDYITKPFTGEELVNTIVKTYNLETKRKQKSAVPRDKGEINSKIISIFSTKGGVGKTTIATNLAVTIARQTKKRVALLDFDLLFGDVAIHLNVSIKTTITELIKEINILDEELMEEYLVTHFSGVRVLPAPVKPEYAEYVTAQHIEKIIKVLKASYHYIIIDTAQNFNETTLTALDASDAVLFISTMDLPTIKNVKSGLEVMDSLHYSDSKVKIVLNKASEQFGITYKDFEDTVKNKIWISIPEDNQTVINSVNKGFPFVLTRAETKVAKSIYEIGYHLTNEKKHISQQKSFFQKILGF